MGSTDLNSGLIISSGKWTGQSLGNENGVVGGNLQVLKTNCGGLAAAQRQCDIHSKRLPVLFGNLIELRNLMLRPIHPLDYLGSGK